MRNVGLMSPCSSRDRCAVRLCSRVLSEIPKYSQTEDKGTAIRKRPSTRILRDDRCPTLQRWDTPCGVICIFSAIHSRDTITDSWPTKNRSSSVATPSSVSMATVSSEPSNSASSAESAPCLRAMLTALTTKFRSVSCSLTVCTRNSESEGVQSVWLNQIGLSEHCLASRTCTFPM